MYQVKRAIGFVVIALVVAAMMSFATLAVASDPASGSATVIPQLVKFSGVVKGTNGQPLTGTIGITFALYTDQQGGAPLWLETQNVQPDSHGNYTVQLGATLPNGLPAALFTTGEARWLGVQAQGQEEQPRVLLLSVPYALKALDAETIGGKPASAFMLAPTNQSGPSGTNPNSTITGSGTADFLPMFTGTTTIGNSKVYQNASGEIGIGTTSPAATLDVKGKGNVLDAARCQRKIETSASPQSRNFRFSAGMGVREGQGTAFEFLAPRTSLSKSFPGRGRISHGLP